MAKDKTVAHVEIEIEYEEMPDIGELREAVQNLNNYGKVTKADLTLDAPTTIDLRD